MDNQSDYVSSAEIVIKFYIITKVLVLTNSEHLPLYYENTDRRLPIPRSSALMRSLSDKEM